MKPIVRNAKSEERDEIVVLVKDASAQYRGELSAEVWEKWMNSIDDDVLSEHGQLIVVEDDGTIQGVVQFFADATRSSQASWPEGTSAIRMLCIRPMSSRRGYGTMLTEECIRRAREIGVSAVFIQTKIWGRFYPMKLFRIINE